VSWKPVPAARSGRWPQGSHRGRPAWCCGRERSVPCARHTRAMDTPPATTPSHLTDVAEAVVAGLDTTLADLVELVRIPSVSADGHDPAHVRASAEQTHRLLEQAGLADVRLLEVTGAHPYVFGQRIVDPDALTVLLYAHHDVQ